MTTTTSTSANPELRKRVENLRSLPSSPAVLQPLLDLLRRPPDEIELSQVVQLIALTHLGDLLCRVRNLGYGYEEWRAIDLAADPAWSELSRHCPKLATLDLARFTLDMDAYISRTTKLVDTIFSPH